jgi:hypothetical protein
MTILPPSLSAEGAMAGHLPGVMLNLTAKSGDRVRIGLTREHALVGAVGDGIDVRRHLVPPLVDVHLDGRLGVDGKAAVRVHRDAKQAGVSLKIQRVR